MRRIIVVLAAPLLALLIAAPVVGRTPTASTGGISTPSRVDKSPKVTLVTVDQGALDIDVSPASGPSTKVTVNYEVENGRVVEATACIGQFDPTSGASAWGCGSFPLSALVIDAGVAHAHLAGVTIPVERCDGAGACTADTTTLTASLTSVRASYESGRDRTDSRIDGCKIVTTSSWENTAATGSLTVDGATYAVEPVVLAASGLAYPAITRSPSTTRTTCY